MLSKQIYKTLTLSIIFQISFVSIHIAQQKDNSKELSDEENYKYQFNTDILLYEYDFKDGNVNESKKQIAKYGWWFYRIGDLKEEMEFGNYYIIRLSTFKPRGTIDTTHVFDSDSKKPVVKGDTSTTHKTYLKLAKAFNGKYFAMKVEDFIEGSKVIKRYSVWKPLPSIGVLIIPIKLRPQTTNQKSGDDVPFDFSQDFMVGTSIGVRFRTSRYNPNYLNIIGSVGITSAIVDSLSTNGIISESNSKMSAFTPSFGILMEFSGIQIGGFVGWDLAGKSIGNNWDYHGKAWYAIGIGYQIFSRNKD